MAKEEHPPLHPPHQQQQEENEAFQDGNSNSNTDTAQPKEPKKLFLTTSDLVRKMNETFATTCGDGVNKVELQVRDPVSGQSYKADADQVRLADLQSKVKQSADFVSQLTSSQEKLTWATLQREEGNEMFRHGHYREAMDVYTTCLVAADVKDTNDEDQSRVESELQLPVLLNLALCALKVKEYGKVIQFCSYALGLPSKCAEDNVKIWFRRGKAQMCRGYYTEARGDFRKALTCSTCIKGSAEEADVRRELRRLVQVERAARINSRKQKKAMQKLLRDNLDTDIGLSAGLYDDRSSRKSYSKLTGDDDATISARKSNSRDVCPTSEQAAREDKNCNISFLPIVTILSAFRDCFKGAFYNVHQKND